MGVRQPTIGFSRQPLADFRALRKIRKRQAELAEDYE